MERKERDPAPSLPENGQGRALTNTNTWSRRSMLCGSLAFSAAACSVPENLVGVPLDPPAPDPSIGVRRQKIFIATSRAASDDTAEFFSGERSPDLNFATVEVSIPPTHAPGQVERPARLPPDPNKHFAIEDPQILTGPAILAETNKELRALPASERRTLIWVHGYNSTLTDAILRLAQFVVDSGYKGVPVLFSWASAGRATQYVYDINSALAARDGLISTAQILGRSSALNIDLIAHSMGNLLTMEAIRGAAQEHLFNTSNKLSNVILAAPDIDIDLFTSQIKALPREQRRFFVLVSEDDQALRLSRLIASGTRVGQADPTKLTALGVNVIDLSKVNDTNSLNHSKFADAPEIVQLLGNRVLAGDTYADSSANGFGEAIAVGANGALSILN